MAKVVAPCPLPWLHEGVRVVRCHMDFQDLAAFNAAKAFDGVQFPGVRCAEIVGKGLVVHPCRIDDEGDTLVVDTIGVDVRTILDAYRTPHTEKLHVMERWRATNGGKGLEAVITVDDPDSFYQPSSLRIRDQRGDEPFLEVICAESNQNFGLFDFHMPVAAKPDF